MTSHFPKLGHVVDAVHDALTAHGHKPYSIAVRYAHTVDVILCNRTNVFPRNVTDLLVSLGADRDNITVSEPYGDEPMQVNVDAPIPALGVTVSIVTSPDPETTDTGEPA